VITPHQLISDKYLELQRMMHANPRGYGQRGDKWAPAVRDLAAHFEATSILDYGCGAGSLMKALRAMNLPGMRLAEYDPAIPGKDSLPTFADLVVASDVLEHIEPRRLDHVLKHLKLLSRKALFVVIATRPAKKLLPNGKNAHLIIEDDAWWENTVREAGFAVHPGPKSPLDKPSKEWVAVLTQ
jgi:hypothetical protein